MKRIGNLYEKIYSIDNLLLADKKARRGKSNRKDVIEFDKRKYKNISDLHNILKENRYKTSKYELFTLYDPKKRDISKLPYFPDRILHHGIMNIVEETFVNTFTSNTYNCIKGRGIHKAFYKLKDNLKDVKNTKYCLKLDIKKFYPNIDNDILKQLLRRKFKDSRLLNLLDEIIDSSVGVPLGNYLSQFFANFYLSYFDHWIKENLKIKYYFRYCDDLVILSSNKEELYRILNEIRIYLKGNLKLDLKSNYQIFPVSKRGIDFLGYKFYHTHILLRKRLKRNFIKMIKYNDNSKSRASYHGWLIHCNSINLRNKYIKIWQKKKHLKKLKS